MSAKVDTWNLALTHLGIGREIASDTEKTEEAKACRAVHDRAIKFILRQYSWPFAEKRAVLGLVQNNPNDAYAHSYRYPSDCIKIRKIYSGIRNEASEIRTPYIIARDDQGRLIYTDDPDGCIVYTMDNEDFSQYPSDFTMAYSFLIAYLTAPRLTAGDPFKLRTDMLRDYRSTVGEAAAASFNEQQPDDEPDSEFIRNR